MAKNRWVEDCIKVVVQKDNVTVCLHVETGDVQVTIKGPDGNFLSAELTRDEVARLHTTVNPR